MKFISYECEFVCKINETQILINKKIKPGNPGIFQNIPGYIPALNRTGIPGIKP